ncbi:hypothetical protein IAT38_002923 [Cryptococcus sp. DSM 104549]
MGTTPNNPLRYDQHTALQQPPYTSDDWVALLTAHLDVIGDAARFPLEEVYPDEPSKVATFRGMQRDRVLMGLGWGLGWGVNKRAFFSKDCSLLLTNIRSPIPQLKEPIPPLYSAEYQRLISSIYRLYGHPVTCALRVPQYGPKAVLSYRSVHLTTFGWPAVILPQPLSEGRYVAPWSRWDEQAEKRYAMETDPARYEEWESASQRAEPASRQGGDEWLFEAKASGVCEHGDARTLCWRCVTDEEDEEDEDMMGEDNGTDEGDE